MDGWIFKQGNDTAWAKKDIVTAGWRKLKPVQLSAQYANKEGRLECWLRIKIKVDSNFINETFGLKGSTWAAADFYIDGKLVASQGNTGSLSYDIIKAHGGEIKVETEEGEGSIFIVQLPFLHESTAYQDQPL